MRQETKLRVPVSTFAKFCALDHQDKQRRLVRDAKNRRGKSGGDYYRGFKGVLKTACQMGQDIETIGCDFAKLIEKEDGPKKERLSILSDAFLSQCRKHKCQFFPVQGVNVTVGRLTFAVAPELGVRICPGDPIAVRLWLSKRELVNRERDTFIYPMCEAKSIAQWPITWAYGVWELELGTIDPVLTVTDELRNFIYERTVRFAEIWDALPE